MNGLSKQPFSPLSQHENPAKPAPKWRKPWIYFASIATFSLLTGVAVVSRLQEPIQSASISDAAGLPVRAVPAHTAPIESWVFGDGNVRAVRAKHLTFEISGTVNTIVQIDGRELREGDRVSAGQLLAQVDDRQLQADLAQSRAAAAEARQQELTAIAQQQQTQAQVEQARAQVEQYRAQVASTEAQRSQAIQNVTRAEADVHRAESNLELAEADFNRYSDLVEQQVVERRQLDVARNAYNEAQASLESARASLRAAHDDVRAAETQIAAAQSQVAAAEQNVIAIEGSVRAADSQIQAARAGVESAEANITRSSVEVEDSQIVAPFDGIVAYLNVREGEYWNPQVVNSTSYQDLIESIPIVIIDPSQYEIEIELPAFEGQQVEPGQRALVVLEQDMTTASQIGLTSEQLTEIAVAEGTVFSVSPSVTPGRRGVEVTVRISHGGDKLKHGARVHTWIAVDENPNAVVAPYRAFVYRDREPHVFVVNPETNHVEERTVELGIEGLSQQEIVRGVEPNERIVVEGQNRLVDGTPVEIIE
ncbi:MAG: efflux RND transporter periplasmic adaptor subunit [Cyanobacteria bacterium SID2]|nr:efflux RND transporter periplasmic adaptor subunit [Cyanobacteria bacterium SID2]MBP0004032.1 efflux RND transporter periplasmic adaptor subunit [Cyanobacteria bacterium SBC]